MEENPDYNQQSRKEGEREERRGRGRKRSGKSRSEDEDDEEEAAHGASWILCRWANSEIETSPSLSMSSALNRDMRSPLYANIFAL